MHIFWQRKLARTTLTTAGCVGFLGGLGLALLGSASSWAWLAGGLVALLPCAWRRAWIALPGVCLAGLFLGLWRGSDELAKVAQYRQFFNQKITLSGAVTDDAGYDDKKQLDFRLEHITIAGRHMPGQVRVKGFTVAPPRRGDTLEVKGKLHDGFGNYQASVYYASIRVMSHNMNIVDSARRHLAAAIYSNMPEPQASLGLGFVLGLKSQLPDSLTSQLKLLGLTHIVVASGYNLTILVRIARRLFEKRSAYQTVIAAAVLMALFLGVTGVSPSMARAALITSLAMWAWYYGRRIQPVLLVVMAAAITAGIRPLYLWGDLGWWLSFLAFSGVLLLAPVVQRLVWQKSQPQLIGQVVIETLCAQATTLPLIVCVFGGLSVLALPANILVVPLIPLAMLLTVGAALHPAAALPATWLLTYTTDIVAGLAAIPWASVPLTLPLWGMLAAYALLLVLLVIAWRRINYNYLSSSIVE